MAGEFDFKDTSARQGGRRGKAPAARSTVRTADASGRVRKKQSSGKLMPVVFGLLALGLVVGVVVAWRILSARHLELGPVASQKVGELAELRLKIPVVGMSRSELRFELAGTVPEGAKIDVATGEFRWQPGEEDGGKSFPIIVRAAAKDDTELHSETRFQIAVEEVQRAPLISPIANRSIKADSALNVQVEATDPDSPSRELVYHFAKGTQGAPPGATIDDKTGQIEWRAAPGSAAGLAPGSYDFTVVVEKRGLSGLPSRQQFRVQVERVETPIDRLVASLGTGGGKVELLGPAEEPGYRGRGHALKVSGSVLRAFEYATAAEARDEAKKPPPAAGVNGTPHVFCQGQFVVLCADGDPKLLALLERKLGPVVTAAKKPEPMAPVASTASTMTERPVEKTSTEDDAVLEIYQKNKLLLRTQKDYENLRKLFAAKFEKENDRLIREGLASDYDDVMAWLNAHPDIKEELYIAIRPDRDQVADVFRIFKQLKQAFPAKLEPYSQLAIATSVTWDQPKEIYDYTNHARRTHSVVAPDQFLGARENFQFFVDQEAVMQGRARWLPWEFLALLVDHKTPLEERKWALDRYLPQRSMFGKCYSDVPYDDEMLRTNSKVCKLDGKPYTLPNILQLGGVCAMQADFAARVGLSMGVPAAYVRGESRSGDLHAWVMWIELRSVTSKSIDFSLESHGRYQYDKYYVGQLDDPQTGQEITDRELELRLHAVGLNPQAQRHAALVMQAYPMIRQRANLDVTHQLLVLRGALDLCPGNEAAWTALAKMAREGQIKPQHHTAMMGAMRAMFSNFADYPDFTWKIFDDFIAFQTDLRQKAKFYEQLVAMYEAAERPDLACEARLKLTEYMVNEKKHKDAILGLALTIKKFPDEGRYVPKMLDRLEDICKRVDGMQPQLLNFYKEFLPLVPQRRGSEASPYAIAMLERGLDRFKEAGDQEMMQVCAAQLDKLKASP